MKITIHRALAELKVLTSRIERAISEMKPLGLYIKGGKVNGIYSEDEFKINAKASVDSVETLIARRTKIKSAIVKSNSTVEVKVGAMTMSVADAITEKSFLTEREKYLSELKRHLTMATGKINIENEKVEKNLQTVIEASYGKDTISKADLIKSTSENFRDTNQVKLLDPLKIEEKIKALELEISSFKTEIDAVLSESNAVTIIDIE